MKFLKRILTFFVIICILSGCVFFGGKYAMKLLYPLGYSQTVRQYSEKYGVEESLIYAVIKSESNFRETAVSEVGAIGLMQITPHTFEWLKTKTGESLEESALYSGEISIKYGTYLLKILLDEFDGEVQTAVAAYHAGIGIVGEWIEDSRYSSDGKTLFYIPYDDTRLYVENVKTAKNIYEKLYDM